MWKRPVTRGQDFPHCCCSLLHACCILFNRHFKSDGCPPCRLCIIAGDISPVDVITPLPVLCEDNDIPYIYVPSKEASVCGHRSAVAQPVCFAC